MKRFNLYFLMAALAVFSVSCTTDDSDDGNSPDESGSQNFKRQTMLEDVADRQIIPSYQRLETDLQTLQESVVNLRDSPNETNLEDAREALHKARLTSQKASFFEFGPAAQQQLRQNLLAWPADSQAIDKAIDDQNAGLGDFNAEKRSLAALEYLLFFPKNSDQWVQSANETPYRMAFANSVIDKLRSRVETVLNGWTVDGGNYRDRFVNELEGSSRGSALSLLTNEFTYSYEQVKTAKVRIPAGLYPGNDAALPEQVEALYSRRSLDYANAALDATADVYNGTHYGEDAGQGFADYLRFLGEEELVVETNEQFQQVRDAVNAIDGSLYEAVEAQPDVVKTAFEKLQGQVRFYKTDMTSVTGVTINYADNDGD